IHATLPAGPLTSPGSVPWLGIDPLIHHAAVLAIDAGDLPAAHSWLVAADRWLAWSGTVPGLAEAQLGWAAFHRAARDHATARRPAEQALSRASEPRQPLALLAAHRLLGELDTEVERRTEAAEHLAIAQALAQACAAPYESALTLLALAELRIMADERK